MAASVEKILVVSGVNLVEAGPLTILRDCLRSAARTLGPEWWIIALVNDQSLIDEPRVHCLEFPAAKKSWLTRLGYEWIWFEQLFADLPIDLWLALHDITPRVTARRQAVYCHNPAPFYKQRLRCREIRMDPTFALFKTFYGSLYKLLIRRNDFLIVQQSWLRAAFRKMSAHPEIIVAHPRVTSPRHDAHRKALRKPSPAAPLVFFYPAMPRFFKNIGLVCEAIRRLSPAAQRLVELRLTITGDENPYARDIGETYRAMGSIKFIGYQSQEGMHRQYQACDVVLFPSKLETWGLPITEAKSYLRPIVAADLAYAHEAVGDYDRVSFLPADQVEPWRSMMAAMIEGTWQFSGHAFAALTPPFAADWDAVWPLVTAGL